MLASASVSASVIYCLRIKLYIIAGGWLNMRRETTGLDELASEVGCKYLQVIYSYVQVIFSGLPFDAALLQSALESGMTGDNCDIYWE